MKEQTPYAGTAVSSTPVRVSSTSPVVLARHLPCDGEVGRALADLGSTRPEIPCFFVGGTEEWSKREAAEKSSGADAAKARESLAPFRHPSAPKSCIV